MVNSMLFRAVRTCFLGSDKHPTGVDAARRSPPGGQGSGPTFRGADLFRVVLSGLLLALATLPSPVTAQRSEDNDARIFYEAGTVAYARGDFEEALDQYERAYRLSPHPELLFNIGQAAERSRRDQRALEAFEGYLATAPEGQSRAYAEQRVTFLRAQLEEGEAAETAEEPAAGNEAAGNETAESQATESESTSAETAPAPTPEETAREAIPDPSAAPPLPVIDASDDGTSGRGWKIGLITAAAVAAVAGIVAIILVTRPDGDNAPSDVGGVIFALGADQ